MFSSYQIDLSPKNSSFIHISNVLSSFIIFLIIRYIIFIPASKFSEILHSDEYNITKFFKRFEKKYDEYEIIEKNALK